MIRAFVALILPLGLHDELEGVQADLSVGRLVPPENFHLTLAFLGEHPRPVLEDLHLALERLTAPAFDVSITGLNVFGRDPPRVLFAEVAKSSELRDLRARVHTAAREAEIVPDARKFHPHITLARFSALDGQEAYDLEAFIARHLGVSAGPFRVSSFGLFQSQLTSRGSAYDLLAEYSLD